MADDNKSLIEINSIDTTCLDSDMKEVTQKLISQSQSQDTQDLINLFNYNMRKKNILRMYKISELEECVIDAIIDRFKKRPGELTHDDLLHYMTTLEASMDRAQKNINNADAVAPVINVQNNNTNVKLNIIEGAGAFTSESKSRISDAIKAFLQQAGSNTNDNPVENVDYVDMTKTDTDQKGEN